MIINVKNYSLVYYYLLTKSKCNYIIKASDEVSREIIKKLKNMSFIFIF